MFGWIRDYCNACAYYVAFTWYIRLTPKKILTESFEDPHSKHSREYSFFLSLIESYQDTLSKFSKAAPRVICFLQERRLRKLLVYAAKTNWWKAYFAQHGVTVSSVRTLNDLRRIPPVHRGNLAEVDKKDLIAFTLPDDEIFWSKSSGSTTGTPLTWACPRYIWRVGVFPHYLLEMERLGVKVSLQDGKNFYVHFNYAGTEEAYKSFFGGSFFVKPNAPDVNEQIVSVVRQMNQIGACVVRCTPSELLFLIQKMKELDLSANVIFCTVTGQVLEENMLAFAEQYLCCKVRPVYGTQELSRLGTSCTSNPEQFHILSDRMLIEILDDAGSPVPPGEYGHITATSLDNILMPLIRYQLGDVGRIIRQEVCECGNTTPLLEIQGRETDFVVCSDGSRIPANKILRIFNQEQLIARTSRVQVQQRSMDTIAILVQLRHGESLSDEHKASIRSRLKTLHPTLVADIEEVREIAQKGAKHLPFISLEKWQSQVELTERF